MTDGGRTRIAMLTPTLLMGGLERVVCDLALALRDQGYECAVFVTHRLGMYADKLRTSGIQVADCRDPRPRIRGYPRTLLKRLWEFRPHIVHAHSGSWLPAVVAKSVQRSFQLVFTDHGRYRPEPARRAVVQRQLERRTDRLITVSAELATYLRDYLRLPSLPTVIENGIDISPYCVPKPETRDALRDKWGVSPEDVLAIWVGRFEPVKNLPGLLWAVATATGEVPNLKLGLIGKGHFEQDVRRHASALGMEDRVVFLGFRDDVADCLAAADLFVLASHSEGIPISLLEALASGLPVVSTAVGGIPEVLGAPAAGRLVPAGDMERLAEALVTVAANPMLRTELGTRALARAQVYSLERCASSYAAVYSALLDADGSGVVRSHISSRAGR